MHLELPNPSEKLRLAGNEHFISGDDGVLRQAPDAGHTVSQDVFVLLLDRGQDGVQGEFALPLSRQHAVDVPKVVVPDDEVNAVLMFDVLRTDLTAA